MKTNQIILSKGIFNLIKDHLKQKNELSDFNKQKLETELKYAQVLPMQQFPSNVVAINTTIRVKDLDTAEVFTFNLVGPSDAKLKNNKLSVLSSIGLALVGYNEGEEVDWEMTDGLKRYRIEKVSVME